MNANMLLILGIAHVAGDYLFQPRCLAEKKAQKLRWLLLHLALYALAMGAVFLCVPAGRAWWVWLILAGSHGLIDGLRVLLDRGRRRPGWLLVSFCGDQTLHLGMLLLCWALWLRGGASSLLVACSAWPWFRRLLVWTAILCVIWDPASVLVRKLFALFPQQVGSLSGTQARSGELIGKLERLIVVALVLAGAASAIGFVLTAKSVARFKQFENDPGFTERYLIGTLLSVSTALIAALLLERLL